MVNLKFDLCKYRITIKKNDKLTPQNESGNWRNLLENIFNTNCWFYDKLLKIDSPKAFPPYLLRFKLN